MPLLPLPDAVRATLHARRAIPGSARPERATKVEAAVRKAFGSKARAGARTPAQLFEAGLRYKGAAELEPARQPAHALLSDFRVAALRSTPIEVLAVAERMLQHVSRELSLASAVAAERSVADAVTVFQRARELVTDAPGGYTTAVRIVARASSDSYKPHYRRAYPLRHVVCAASEEAYRAARTTAHRHREERELPERAELAFVFPDEPWATEDIEAWLADTKYRDGRVAVAALATATTDARAVRRLTEVCEASQFVPYALDLAAGLPADDALAILGDMVPALLKRPSFGPVLKTPPRTVVQALTWLDHPGVPKLLAQYAANSILGPLVVEYFRAHPEHAPALAREGKGKGKAAAIAERTSRGRAAPSRIASPDEVPPVLRAPPWRAKRSKARAPTVIADLSLQGLELERLERGGLPPKSFDEPAAEMTDEQLARWKKAVAEDKYVGADYHWEYVGKERRWLVVPAEEGLRAWNEASRCHLSTGPRAWVARHGFACLPGFFQRDWAGRWLTYETDDEMMLALLSFVSPRTAPAVARLATRKASRRVAVGWMLAHAEIAALGLVPDAVGPPGEARDAAENMLLYLARKEECDTVQRAAQRYGEAASQAVRALLARDPLAVDRAVPKRPAFLHPRELPPVRLGSGASLGEEAVSALLDMLALSPVDPPYPGIALVREACDSSLETFVLELLEQWVLGDAPGRHEWMLWAAVHVPSDAATRRIGALAREWSRASGAKASRACAALAALGTDLALLHLSHVADSTRFASLREETVGLVAEAARARGLSEDELGDRTVPDVGLDAQGTLTLSYGPRSFVIALDEALTPEVRERTERGPGQKARTLPRAAKTDDQALAKSARARFDALKADLASVAVRQIRRLERAMVDGRTWTWSAFEEWLAKQPLLVHLARRLVWEVVAGPTFRVAEDGSYADVHDRLLEPAASATVRLAHPARGDGLASWTTVFGDYEIAQPFEQLGRSVFRRERGEETARELARVGGFNVPAKRVLGVLEARSWRRNDPGHVTRYRKTLRGERAEPLTLVWPLSPGISMEDLAHEPDQRMGAVVLDSGLSLSAIDEVGFSELVRDAEALRPS